MPNPKKSITNFRSRDHTHSWPVLPHARVYLLETWIWDSSSDFRFTSFSFLIGRFQKLSFCVRLPPSSLARWFAQLHLILFMKWILLKFSLSFFLMINNFILSFILILRTDLSNAFNYGVSNISLKDTLIYTTQEKFLIHILPQQYHMSQKNGPQLNKTNGQVNKTLFFSLASGFSGLNVRPHYAVWYTVAQSGKAAQQKSHHAVSICGRCAGLAAACRSMRRGLKIWLANCRSHQRKPRGIWWVRGFKMVSASFRKNQTKFTSLIPQFL